MLDFLYDLWVIYFDRRPAPETWSEALAENERNFPNSRILQQWNAEYELTRRKELGIRGHDA